MNRPEVVRYHPAPGRAARAAMALSKLSGDEQWILFTQLCNVLEPRASRCTSAVPAMSCGS